MIKLHVHQRGLIYAGMSGIVRHDGRGCSVLLALFAPESWHNMRWNLDEVIGKAITLVY